MWAVRRPSGRGVALAVLFSCMLAVTAPASATTFVPVPTHLLAEEAVAVVVGSVARVESFWDSAQRQIFTDVKLSLHEVLKGDLRLAELTIRQVGGVVGDDESWVFGSPQFLLGERVLLFLRLNPDGTPRVAHLYQGKFTVLSDESTGEEFAYRDARPEGVRVMAQGGPPPADYDLHPLREFKEWIRAVIQANPESEAHARVESSRMVPSATPSEAVPVQEQFTFLDPQAPARWFEPDSSLPVTMFMNSQGEPAAPDLGFEQIRSAYQAWSTVPGSSFRYQDGGFTSAGGFQVDGVNTISFRDPLNQMDPPSGCSGVLAIGGYFRSGSQTTTVNGQSFFKILEGDVVFNDGWQGCGFYESFTNFAEVATHELGHVGGLGHSSDSSATMYAFAHFDGRGASLGTDDISGWQFLYPASSPVTTPDITVTPLSLAFGSVAVGSTSASQVVTLRNDGTASLGLGALSLGGANPSEFLKSSDLCSSITLAPGQSCTVSAQFRPGTTGAKSATLVIPSNDPDENPVSVALSGTGGSGGGGGVPDITGTPLSLAFGSVAVGSSSTSQVVTVQNDGTASLVLGKLTLGGATPSDFQKPSDSCSSMTLAPGQSCTVSVRFKPKTTGAKNASLLIPSNDLDENPVSVALSGTGI